MSKEKTFYHRERREHREKIIFFLRSLCPLWFILVFSACIPATPPANVSATPGEAVTITQNTYANSVFSVVYPTKWRVITSPAGAPPSVTLVAPGDCTLIIISASATIDQSITSPSCDQANIQTGTQTVMLGDQPITIAGSAPNDQWDEFTQALDRVSATLKAAS